MERFVGGQTHHYPKGPGSHRPEIFHNRYIYTLQLLQSN